MKYLLCVLPILFVLTVTQSGAKAGKKIKKQYEKGFVLTNDKKLISDQTEKTTSFDSAGNIQQETSSRFYSEINRALNNRKQYYYGKGTKLDSVIVFSDDKFALKLTYTYNNNNQLTEIQEYNLERKPSYLTKMFYDSAGNMIKEKLFDKENKLYNHKDYTYNRNSLLVDEEGTELGEKRYHWIYTYNTKNLLVVRKDFSGKEKLLRKHTYVYDEDQLLVKENITNPAGDLERIIEYRYEFY